MRNEAIFAGLVGRALIEPAQGGYFTAVAANYVAARGLGIEVFSAPANTDLVVEVRRPDS